MKFNSNQCFALFGRYVALLLAGTGAGTVIGKFTVWAMGMATESQTIDLAFYGVMFTLGLVASVAVGFIPKSKLTPTE